MAGINNWDQTSSKNVLRAKPAGFCDTVLGRQEQSGGKVPKCLLGVWPELTSGNGCGNARNSV